MKLLKIYNGEVLFTSKQMKKELKETLEKEKISLYCGVDPTADSMHIGHLLPYLNIKTFPTSMVTVRSFLLVEQQG